MEGRGGEGGGEGGEGGRVGVDDGKKVVDGLGKEEVGGGGGRGREGRGGEEVGEEEGFGAPPKREVSTGGLGRVLEKEEEDVLELLAGGRGKKKGRGIEVVGFDSKREKKVRKKKEKYKEINIKK